MNTIDRRTLVELGALSVVTVALAALLSRLTSVDSLAWNVGAERYELLSPLALVALAVVPFLAWVAARSLADLPRTQRAVGLAVRTLIAACLTLALAQLARMTDTAQVSTIVLVDVSDSVSASALSRAQERVNELWSAKGDHDLQVVTFAASARAVPPAGDGAGPPAIARHATPPQAGAGSDLQAALQLAYGLFPSGHLRRVLLISDGNETHGNVLSEASRAAELGVRIDHDPILEGAPPEMAIRELTLPQRIKVGEPFHVRARIFANTPGRARVRLYQGETINGLGGIRDLTLEAGTNDVEFSSIVRVSGPVTYRLQLDARSEDQFQANNNYETSVVVPGRPTVLYVEGARGRATYLARALGTADFDVEVRNPRAIPTSVRELERYDFFILSDVPADQVSLTQMDAIERYVRDLGGGFMMAGGENSFGLGGWQGTRMERMLPVRMDAQRRRDQPSLAIVLVIDKSGSMGGSRKIELAKEAAKATAQLLGPDDYLEVIGFDSAPQRIVRMQSARNRAHIMRDIGRLAARGGTNIFPALDMAYQDLAVTRARIKHVILLTDGQSPEQGISELTRAMRAEGMTVSTVGLGSDVNRALLQSVANLGGGRAYFTNDPHNIPRIFVRETSTVARSSAVEDYFQPQVVHRADFLRGIELRSAPFLRGYVATQAKPEPAQVVLQSELAEPILARWRIGLGWSLAWTSDVKNRWSVDWLRWSSFSRFWAQLVREHMRRRHRSTLDMRAEVIDGAAHVVVDAIGGDDRFLNDLESTLVVRGPIGATAGRRRGAGARADAGTPDAGEASRRSAESRRTEVPLEQTAPGRYEATVPLDGFGSYLLSAQHRRGDRIVADSRGHISNPYPREYQALEPAEGVLRQLSEVTGGTPSPTPRAVFDPGEEVIRHHQPLWPHLVALALLLFLIDLLLRRVRLFGHTA